VQYNYIGKTCPFCQFAIKSNSSAVLCPTCKVPHHQACWEENRGCTTFGCKETTFEAPVSDRVDQPLGTSAANRQAVTASSNLNAFLAVALAFSIFAIIVLTIRLNADQQVKVASPAPQTTHQTTQQITTQTTTAAPTTTTARPTTTTARPTTTTARSTTAATTTRAKTAPPTRTQTTNGTWWVLDF